MNYLKEISLSIFCCFLILFTEGLLIADSDSKDYWKQLNEKANKVYDGWDISVQMNTGLEHREYFQGVRTGPYGNVELSIPLYSKKEKIEKIKSKTEFLKSGAEQIKIIEERNLKIEILKEKTKYLKAIMQEEGTTGIKAYYDVLEEITKNSAEIKEAKRKLEAMLQ